MAFNATGTATQKLIDESSFEESSSYNSEAQITRSVACTAENLSEGKSIEDFTKEVELYNDDLLASLFTKCNKSNATKNILYQFKDFIETTGDQVVLESILDGRSLAQIRKEFHNFSRKKQLNHSFVVALLKSKRFNKSFAYFLAYYAADWLRSGKVKNIPEHVVCISFLHRCHNHPGLVENIITYKKRRD